MHSFHKTTPNTPQSSQNHFGIVCRMAGTCKVLIAGPCQGKLATLMKRVATVNQKNGPFDMLFCLGSLFNTTGVQIHTLVQEVHTNTCIITPSRHGRRPGYRSTAQGTPGRSRSHTRTHLLYRRLGNGGGCRAARTRHQPASQASLPWTVCGAHPHQAHAMNNPTTGQVYSRFKD